VDFLNQFTLYDVFLVALGLVLASIIRIFYDSYKEKKRLEKLGHMIKVYNKSMDAYEEGILILSDKNEVVFANKEALRIFAVERTALDAEYLEGFVRVRLNGASDEVPFLDMIQLRKNIPHAYITSGDSTTPVSINTNIFRMHLDHDNAWRIVIIQDIADKLKLEERMESMGSYKDLLTNLPTRYHLTSDLVSVILKSVQNNHQAAIALFAIKDFTLLQLHHGIEKIDMLMRQIAKELSDMMEWRDTLYRFNCDTFAVIFDKLTDENEARRKIDRIILKVHNILAAEGIKTTTMQGLYFIHHTENATAERVLNESFRILHSKSNERIIGRESVFLNENVDAGSAQYLASKLTKNDFIQGIQNKDFFFFYQPIYRLDDEQMIGVEVLTRFNHKQYGFLMAENFLPKAIEYGVMSEITAHLLDNVLGQKQFWVNEGKLDLDLTINLALSDLQAGSFTEMLEEKLEQYGVDPKTIIIDIPEVVLAEDFEAVSEEFYMLRKMGVRLAIDHFGKEYINLKHIEKLPLDIIKIDGSIIENIDSSKHKTRLVSSIVSIGKDLGLRVGAIHVDSAEIKEKVATLGCEFAQGYYFGKAVPAFEITDMIKKGAL